MKHCDVENFTAVNLTSTIPNKLPTKERAYSVASSDPSALGNAVHKILRKQKEELLSQVKDSKNSNSEFKEGLGTFPRQDRRNETID